MAIQGLRDTANFVADQRPKNWREGILLLYPNGKTALLGLTALMKSRVVDDPEYNWWEKNLDDRRFVLGASLDATGPSDTVTLVAAAAGVPNGKSLKINDLLLVEQSGEILRVNALPSSETSIAVDRAFGDTAATAVTFNGAGVNPNLLLIGNAMEEGSAAPTGIGYDPTKRTNYTQIFRDTLEATRTAIKTRLRTGDAVREAKRECLEYHGIGIERAMWHSQSKETTLNGHPQRAMDGVFAQIDSGNVKVVSTDYATGLTMAGLEEYMYNIFKFGSSEKMGICGNRALLTVQQVIRKNASWQFQSGLKEAGMNVARLISPFGEIVLKSHPLWNQVTGGTTAGTAYYGMESWLCVLDMAQATYVYLKESDTQYQPQLGTNDLDGMKSGYLSECSIELHHPLSHYLLKNMVLAAVDA